jgi:hypothetical protein
MDWGVFATGFFVKKTRGKSFKHSFAVRIQITSEAQPPTVGQALSLPVKGASRPVPANSICLHHVSLCKDSSRDSTMHIGVSNQETPIY